MSRTEPLGGSLWLRPGQPRPHNLRSTRPDWVGRITRGLPASRLPATLGSLFSLCGHAHIICAGMAVDAALGRDEPAPATARAQLARQTLREHLRRIWLEWPRQLAAAPVPEATLDAAGRRLAQCPVFASATADAAPWLEAHAVGMPLLSWLENWERDPAAWLMTWCRQTKGFLPQLMRQCQPVASAALPAVPALRVHADAGALRSWTAQLHDDRTARQPRWQGDCAETGVWTRLNEVAAQRLDTPWLRLGARLAEGLRLALPDERARSGSAWLDLGALPLGPGEALAWVEMARGLLVHHVQLEGRHDAARVVACQVIAPTEWNFHADGAVARVLERMPPHVAADERYRLDALMAAYDPCVPFQLELQMSHEVAHA